MDEETEAQRPSEACFSAGLLTPPLCCWEPASGCLSLREAPCSSSREDGAATLFWGGAVRTPGQAGGQLSSGLSCLENVASVHFTASKELGAERSRIAFDILLHFKGDKTEFCRGWGETTTLSHTLV